MPRAAGKGAVLQALQVLFRERLALNSSRSKGWAGGGISRAGTTGIVISPAWTTGGFIDFGHDSFLKTRGLLSSGITVSLLLGVLRRGRFRHWSRDFVGGDKVASVFIPSYSIIFTCNWAASTLQYIILSVMEPRAFYPIAPLLI